MQDIRTQVLWYNKDILIDGKPCFKRNLYNHSLVYINDVIDANGRFLCIGDINRKFNIEMCVMLYNSIKDAIPLSWKRNMITCEPLMIVTKSSITVKTYEGVKTLPNITTKVIYWTLVSKMTQSPTANAKWEKIYAHCDFNWKQIFLTPYRLIRDTKIQSLQFKILHRFFPCNLILNKWYNDHSDKCSFCNEIDTLEHYFVECDRLKFFWSNFLKWWYSLSKIKLTLSTLDVLFGIPNENSDHFIDLINYCIFYDFLCQLKTTLEGEKFSYTDNDKLDIFNKSLAVIYNAL